MSNHKDGCPRTCWFHSGSGYNRVRVCACGAEDHEPESYPMLRTCCRKHWGEQELTFMLVCGTCGNKRCPKATDCELACTGSNERGQPGSCYT